MARVPNVAVQSPWSPDRIKTAAPGMAFSFMSSGICCSRVAAYAGALDFDVVDGDFDVESPSSDDPHDAMTNMVVSANATPTDRLVRRISLPEQRWPMPSMYRMEPLRR
jgi:hypothetical protein